VPVEYDGFERFSPDRTLNLGSHGVFILSRRPLLVGRWVQIRFELPDLKIEIHATGRVVWSPKEAIGSGRHHPSGMGIRFDDDQTALLRLLEAYVDVEAEVTSAFADTERPEGPVTEPEKILSEEN
jgi:uncharacterized protein (TIGR02266 family)